MENAFITKIHFDFVRHLENIDINLSDTELSHLILTGKNGSGKTSVLQAIKNYVEGSYNSQHGAKYFGEVPVIHHEAALENTPLDFLNGINYHLQISTNEKFKVNEMIFVYFPADRFKRFEIPRTIESRDIGWSGGKHILKSHNEFFLKYLLYLRHIYTEVKLAQKDSVEIKKYEQWFDDFEDILKEIYGSPELKLEYHPKSLSFSINTPDRAPFTLNQMADGFFSFVKIVVELMLRMDNFHDEIDFSKNAIVFIDEIETHLHVDLQKKILPILVKLFSNTQFIVTTHSPFVITSLPNAIVYDLESNKMLENPTQFSYESIIESYYASDLYSLEIKRIFDEYRKLAEIEERTDAQEKEFSHLRMELKKISPMEKELYLAFRDFEEKRRAVNNGKTA